MFYSQSVMNNLSKQVNFILENIRLPVGVDVNSFKRAEIKTIYGQNNGKTAGN
jgi:hypothetical protein